MTADDPVGVEHGHEFEDERPPEGDGPGVVLAQDELEEAVEHEAARRLARVHTTRQEKHLQTPPHTHNTLSMTTQTSQTFTLLFMLYQSDF